MRSRAIPLSISIVALAAQSLGLASPALAASPVNVPFSYTGAQQTWSVPTGVLSIHVDLIGAAGGSIIFGGAPGGLGGHVSGDLAVSPGATLYVEVGQDGSAAAGAVAFNGGGAGGNGTVDGLSGGGASDIRTVSMASGGTLASRLIVAAGGGGAGGNGFSVGFGGDAGSPGLQGTSPATGGGAGTQVAGGAGGSVNGQPGVAGIGGTGGVPIAATTTGGGGGGGGWYGGGGGGGITGSTSEAGGGGGGSNYLGSATNGSVGLDTGKVPSITITYTPSAGGVDHGTVDAVVTMASSVVCLELSASAIDFGTRQFGDVGIAADPAILVTNCSIVTEDVLARGTDASGDGPTTWVLDDTGTCAAATLPTDHFALALERQDSNAQVRLGTSNKPLETLSNGAAISHLARIDTPCPGGSGAGVIMTMHITFVATEPAP